MEIKDQQLFRQKEHSGSDDKIAEAVVQGALRKFSGEARARTQTMVHTPNAPDDDLETLEDAGVRAPTFFYSWSLEINSPL